MNATDWLGPLAALAFLGGSAVLTRAAEELHIPATLQVPANQQLLLTVAATGDQIYTCQADSAQPDRYAWTLKAPEAVLYNDDGQAVGHHYQGPTWEMNDGSQIVGQLQAKADAPTTNAIPWLLLQVKSHAGRGVLSQVNWIQRVNTVGGKAPLEICDATHKDKEVRVNYQASYYFYGN